MALTQKLHADLLPTLNSDAAGSSTSELRDLEPPATIIHSDSVPSVSHKDLVSGASGILTSPVLDDAGLNGTESQTLSESRADYLSPTERSFTSRNSSPCQSLSLTQIVTVAEVHHTDDEYDIAGCSLADILDTDRWLNIDNIMHDPQMPDQLQNVILELDKTTSLECSDLLPPAPAPALSNTIEPRIDTAQRTASKSMKRVKTRAFSAIFK